jgi:RNA polymerase sigma-70 factor (ECF subfamily)
MTCELVTVFAGFSGSPGAIDDVFNAELRSLVEAGRAAWPDVHLDAAVFVRHVAERTSGDRALVRSIHAGDLFLACACKEREPSAVNALSRTHLSRVPAYLARMRPTPDFCDEVRQIVSEKVLLSTPQSPPKIGEYSGRGSLDAWLRVVVVRIALHLRQQRREEPEATGDPVARILASQADPELDYIRRRYASELVEALRIAFATLSHDQRLVLRLHVLNGLTGDQIASVLQIHRATVVRWIRRAREDILRAAKQHLHVPPSELESLGKLLHSQLDVSLSGLLAVTVD